MLIGNSRDGKPRGRFFFCRDPKACRGRNRTYDEPATRRVQNVFDPPSQPRMTQRAHRPPGVSESPPAGQFLAQAPHSSLTRRLRHE